MLGGKAVTLPHLPVVVEDCCRSCHCGPRRLFRWEEINNKRSKKKAKQRTTWTVVVTTNTLILTTQANVTCSNLFRSIFPSMYHRFVHQYRHMYATRIINRCNDSETNYGLVTKRWWWKLVPHTESRRHLKVSTHTSQSNQTSTTPSTPLASIASFVTEWESVHSFRPRFRSIWT